MLTPVNAAATRVTPAHLSRDRILDFDGMDSLLSIVQMPAGVPVATVSIGGARNAGLLAVRILAAADPELRTAMEQFQASLETMVLDKDAALRTRLPG